MSSLSPKEITSKKSSTMISYFHELVNELFENKWISSTHEAENTEKQYKEMLNNKDFLAEDGKFDMANDRIDQFYSRILDSAKTAQLEKIVRMIVIISHKNARVEAGFSVNDDILIPNQAEKTIVGQRLFYEGVQKEGGPSKVEITGEMMKLVRSSHRMYDTENKEKQKKQTEGQKRIIEKRKATIELDQLIAAKKSLGG